MTRSILSDLYTIRFTQSHKIIKIEIWFFRRKKEKSLDYNNSFLGEYECSSLAPDREEMRYEKEEIGSLKTRSNNVNDQEI
ncbi:hypothetical protein Tco_0924269 [Tanacetum coccineum]|uniref:Uncharacterized protein n=1 Tax=Tanacetum coccineum TaxID=301880 RepID=A0ABQ5D4S0_9ASTR